MSRAFTELKADLLDILSTLSKECYLEIRMVAADDGQTWALKAAAGCTYKCPQNAP